MGPSSFHIEELLAHADWLRRLARHVAREDADDVVQETWVAALRSGPAARIARPWLAEVLRNFARRALRTDRARQAREERVEPLDTPATPETLVERAEAQRLLAGLVMALDEPSRSTVLLRYFEGLSAAEIARVQDIPAGTVRWRLKEGLDRLRAALDDRHGQDRRAWVLLLSPLIERPPALSIGGITLAIATQKKLAGLLAVLAVLLLGAGGLMWRRSSAPKPPPPVAAARLEPPPRPAPRLPAIAVPAGEIVRDRSPTGSVEGQVVSRVDGAGIGGAELTFSFGDSSLPVTADASGRFRFAPKDAGLYLLARVSAEGYVPFSPDWGDSSISLVLRPGETIRGVRLALRPITICPGLVVDPAGKAVAGAQITTFVPGRATFDPRPALENAPGNTVTDPQGRFSYTLIEGGFIEAHHQGRRAFEQMSYSVFLPCNLRLQLAPGPDLPVVAISGRVVGPDGQPVAGATVEAWSNPVLETKVNHSFARVVSGEDGRFQLMPLDPIIYGLSAMQNGRMVADGGDVRGGTRDVILRVSAAGRLRGQVKDAASGAPVTSFSVILSRQQREGGAVGGGIFTRYDPRGTFELEGIPAGRYRVSAIAEQWAPADEQVVEVLPEPAAAPELAFLLKQGGRIRGRVTDRASGQPIDGAWVSVEGRAGAAQNAPLRTQTVSDGEGRFELRGVGKGFLSVLASAAGHHGRVVGGLQMQEGGELGPLEVDLAPSKEGERPRIEFVGIGAAMAKKGDAVVLGGLTPDGGAARAGLVSGDEILAVDGMTVERLGGTLGDVVQRIRGVEGTVVVLRVRRAADGWVGDVRVTRRLVRSP
jgi:RNA polymerase sigma factor (sigma-70 family)